MNQSFDDIYSRIKEDPTWWDENGVPRYDEFHPSYISNIYANEVMLILIHCQSCCHPFRVAVHKSAFDHVHSDRSLRDSIPDVGYGDPPNMGCCAAGPSMQSESIRVLEYWESDSNIEWVRRPEFEVDLIDAERHINCRNI